MTEPLFILSQIPSRPLRLYSARVNLSKFSQTIAFHEFHFRGGGGVMSLKIICTCSARWSVSYIF